MYITCTKICGQNSEKRTFSHLFNSVCLAMAMLQVRERGQNKGYWMDLKYMQHFSEICTAFTYVSYKLPNV